MKLTSILAMLILGTQAQAWAQVTADQTAAVVYGHHHVSATSVDAHKRFWVEALGGRSIKVGTSPTEVVRFPGVLVFLAARAATGGTKGTTVNHVGFETSDLRAAVDRVKAAGFPVVTGDEVPSSYEVKDGLARRPGGNLVAFVMGPDDTKVELVESSAVPLALQLHHIHFAAPDPPAMQAWYARTFGGRIGTRIEQPAVDLPGVNLTYGLAPGPVAPTRGRALDHLGFEVKNLEQFCRDLEARGVTLDRPYTKVPALGIAIAFFTDPWGTYIELTEGLNQVP